jgi:hypothetical protein
MQVQVMGWHVSEGGGYVQSFKKSQPHPLFSVGKVAAWFKGDSVIHAYQEEDTCLRRQ